MVQETEEPKPWQFLAWPAFRLGEAIEEIARQQKLPAQSPEHRPNPPHDLYGPDAAGLDEERLGQWLDHVAAGWGLEVEPVQASYAEAEPFIRGAGPALFRLPDLLSPSEPRFLVVLKSGRWRSILLDPNLTMRRISPRALQDALCVELEAPYLTSIKEFCAQLGVPSRRQARARRAILATQLSSESIRGCWLVRLAPNAPLWRQAQDAFLPRTAVALVSGYLGQLSATVAAWWLIGHSAFTGQLDRVWLWGWTLMLLTSIACQGLAIAAQGRLGVGAGGLIKIRLLYGALRLQPEEVRHQGAGQFLGRVSEAEAVELLALGGGMALVLSAMQLAMAAGLLAMGAGSWPHALLLAAWAAVPLGIAWRYALRHHIWADAHRDMTNDLVERMVGHRTRLAQEDRASWHDEEDRLLDRYTQCSQALDRLLPLLQGLTPRGWMLLGLLGIVAALLMAPRSPIQVAISLGGFLLALQALTQLATGLQSLAGATTAWRQIGPLFRVAGHPRDVPSGRPLASRQSNARTRTEDGEPETPVMAVRDVSFRYRAASPQVLRGCSLSMRPDDRLLLEGPSGGGKSTLAGLLAGQRLPESGLLLLRGYDRMTLGADEWRRRVVMAPQFHENHVMTNTLAFNLLMGRRWPPRSEDLADAEAVCRELGLDELLERMPAGLQQMVGESGWQLSHGERSRLYIARALLQEADVLIFDESFGALDPENLQRALHCVLRRAPALVVIAHP
ncbi:ATP-binding cassette domain-containing protein [Candidatus Entotheonella palauensis]|uniref:ATP-binding cassette domain-containing protein n=1 Tax=Candidatus Entotheonella palauensis TaxID=93172 RepID=UPI000B7D6F14|nr:ABC transporter ATP-binding protein [Candidatus Entotheonella palauensis]